MRTIAVTGGIGSGKTAVCDILRAQGVPVYDSDSAAKKLYSKDDSLLDSIEEAFGCSCRLDGGVPDLKKLSSVAFSSPEKLRELEKLVHPAVLNDFKRWQTMQSSRFSETKEEGMFFGNMPFVVIESAIILEKKEFLAAVDKVVLVDAPLAVRLARATSRDNVSAEMIVKRMTNQRFDLSKVNAFIKNDGTFEDLKKNVFELFKNI